MFWGWVRWWLSWHIVRRTSRRRTSVFESASILFLNYHCQRRWLLRLLVLRRRASIDERVNWEWDLFTVGHDVFVSDSIDQMRRNGWCRCRYFTFNRRWRCFKVLGVKFRWNGTFVVHVIREGVRRDFSLLVMSLVLMEVVFVERGQRCRWRHEHLTSWIVRCLLYQCCHWMEVWGKKLEGFSQTISVKHAPSKRSRERLTRKTSFPSQVSFSLLSKTCPMIGCSKLLWEENECSFFVVEESWVNQDIFDAQEDYDIISWYSWVCDLHARDFIRRKGCSSLSVWMH